MSLSTVLARASATPRLPDETLARAGTLGVVAAGLMALLVLML
jgi:hypothetical protein